VRFKGPRCGCSYYARPQSGGIYLKSEFGSRDLEVCLKTLIFRGLFFHFWAVFCLFWSILAKITIFWALFFLFSLFFHFRRRYTRTEEGRLCKCSVEKGFKAGQLGPRAYRIFHSCPGCGFALKCLVSLGPIDLGGGSEYFLSPGCGLPGKLCVQCERTGDGPVTEHVVDHVV
jgi:hypothetical protein